MLRRLSETSRQDTDVASLQRQPPAARYLRQRVTPLDFRGHPSLRGDAAVPPNPIRFVNAPDLIKFCSFFDSKKLCSSKKFSGATGLKTTSLPKTEACY